MKANIIFLYSDIHGFANEKMANIMRLISSLSSDRQQSATCCKVPADITWLCPCFIVLCCYWYKSNETLNILEWKAFGSGYFISPFEICLHTTRPMVISRMCTAIASVNKLRPRQNGRHVPDDIFKSIFLKEKISISLKISLKFVPNFEFTIFHYWLR